MANKIVISYDQVFNMVNSLNNEEKTMADFEKEYECNRKSIRRRFKEFGYVYDRASRLWSLPDGVDGKEREIPSNKQKQNVSSKKTNTMSDESDITTITTTEEEKGAIGRPKEYTTIVEEAEEQGLTLIVKRTYNIPRELDKDIKIYAALNDKKPAEVVREALEQYIDKHYKLKDIIGQDNRK